MSVQPYNPVLMMWARQIYSIIFILILVLFIGYVLMNLFASWEHILIFGEFRKWAAELFYILPRLVILYVAVNPDLFDFLAKSVISNLNAVLPKPGPMCTDVLDVQGFLTGSLIGYWFNWFFKAVPALITVVGWMFGAVREVLWFYIFIPMLAFLVMAALDLIALFLLSIAPMLAIVGAFLLLIPVTRIIGGYLLALGYASVFFLPLGIYMSCYSLDMWNAFTKSIIVATIMDFIMTPQMYVLLFGHVVSFILLIQAVKYAGAWVARKFMVFGII